MVHYTPNSGHISFSGGTSSAQDPPPSCLYLDFEFQAGKKWYQQVDTCLSKCMASHLSWLSVKHRIASTDTDSFLFYAHSSFSNLLLFPIFIPLRGDPPNSLPISCGTFCLKVYYCVPAQICSTPTYCFLFAGRGLSCSKAKTPSSLWSCWYCWLLPWILCPLYTCSLIFLLLSWLLFWHLPLLSFQCHVPQWCSWPSSHTYLGSMIHQLLFLRRLCSAHLHPLDMIFIFPVYLLNWSTCPGSACPSLCSESFWTVSWFFSVHLFS